MKVAPVSSRLHAAATAATTNARTGRAVVRIASSEGRVHADGDEPRLRIASQIHAGTLRAAEGAHFGIEPGVPGPGHEVDRVDVQPRGPRLRERQGVAELHVLQA